MRTRSKQPNFKITAMQANKNRNTCIFISCPFASFQQEFSQTFSHFHCEMPFEVWKKLPYLQRICTCHWLNGSLIRYVRNFQGDMHSNQELILMAQFFLIRNFFLNLNASTSFVEFRFCLTSSCAGYFWQPNTISCILDELVVVCELYHYNSFFADRFKTHVI